MNRPIDPDDLLDTAFEAAEAGRLVEAETLCGRALDLDPRNFDAVLLLGVIAGETDRLELAETMLRRAVAIEPESAEAHLKLGGLLSRAGKSAEAIPALQAAVRLGPDMALAHHDLGVVYLESGRVRDAIACFERAVACAPDLAVAHHRLGYAFELEGDDARAITAYGCAIELEPDLAEALTRFGALLLGQGRFDEAVACFERTLKGDPAHVLAHHGLVNSRKLTEADRPLLGRMAALLDDPHLPDRDRTMLHFALGKALDDLGDHESAIRHFNAGNRLKRSTCVFDEAKLARFVDLSISGFTRDFLTRSAAHGSRSELPILIIGMPRSGTTLVEQILSSHPEIAGAGELLFWSDRAARLGQISVDGFEPAMMKSFAEEYLALLTNLAPGAARVADKMPENFRYAGLIYAVFPNARIIHCRRDPIDTALSIYFTEFAQGMEYAYDRADIVAAYRQYLRVTAHWRAVLPPDRFLEIDYESVVEHQERATRALIDFCGLDWDDACLRHGDNRRVVKTASFWQARQPIYRSSIARWKRYEPWLGELRNLLDDESTGYGRWVRGAKKSGARRRRS